ncbi:MAG: cold shock domain-containing protein [Bowdeniella nasicola]|nr:cold shock domain-containing protein [Bowdeniella nasicola]
MPSGKVKWFDAEKGFGFVTGDDGVEVFLHANALPEGVTSLRAGTRLEYSIADGRRGPQAMFVELAAPAPSVARNLRRKPREMVPIVEDLIRMLDASSNALRRGRYPEHGHKIAQVLRAVADDFDA